MKESIIAITMGDAAGISPEIILKSFLKEEMNNVQAVVIGCYVTLTKAMSHLKISGLELKKISDLKH